MPHNAKSSDFVITLWEFRQITPQLPLSSIRAGAFVKQ
jgi:hypothetical protein